MFNKKTPKKDQGSVSFALLGVLIIFLSIVALAYISRVSLLGYRRELQEEEISSLEEMGEKVLDDIEYQVRELAARTAFEQRGEEVNENFKERLSGLFPSSDDLQSLSKGGKDAVINQYRLDLKKDIVRADDVIPDIGSIKNGNIGRDSPGKVGKARTVFDYRLDGSLTILVEDEEADIQIEKKRYIDTDVDVPYPFIHRKVDQFENDVGSENGQVSRMTRYILSTLAQYRVMLGHGMKAKEHVPVQDLGDTSDIIRLKDVELALNFALLSEIAYRFRAIDRGSLDSMMNETDIQNVTSLETLLIEYSRTGIFDPADIISLYYGSGYDHGCVPKKRTTGLNLTSIAGQSIHTISDEFVLRYLDYLHIAPMLGRVHGPFKSLENFMSTGEHYLKNLVQNENSTKDLTKMKIVKNWVRNTFAACGLTSTWIMRHNFTSTPFDSYEGDEIEGYPRLSTGINEEFSYTLKLIHPDRRWYIYPCGHGPDDWHEKSGPCSEVITVDEEHDLKVKCGRDEKLVGYDYKTIEYDIDIEEGAPICFHSEDILKGNNDLWMDFYYRFENRTDADVMGEDTLRGAINDLIADMVQRIYSEIQLEDRIRVDPKDDSSVFEGIQSRLTETFGEVDQYYRQNPDIIKQVIYDRLHTDGDRRVKDLKEWLKDNYDELIDKERAVEETIQRTAVELTSPDSPYMELTRKATSTEARKINEECDQVCYEEVEPTRENLSFKIQNDEVIMGAIKDAISPSVENGFDQIKSREIDESELTETSSEEDGMIIQALDYYQHVERTSSENDVSLGSSEPSRDSCTSSSSAQNRSQSSSVEERARNLGEDGAEGRGKEERKRGGSSPRTKTDGVMKKTFHKKKPSPQTVDPVRETAEKEKTRRGLTEKLLLNADFSIIPSPSVPEKTISFIDDSYDPDGEIVQWRWEFGDGNTSTEENTTHAYERPGTYTVKLTVTDDDCNSDEHTEDLIIDNAPRVIDVSPPSNESWETDQAVTFTFSERVDGTSLEYELSPSHVIYDVSSNNYDPVTATEELVLTPKDYYERRTDYTLTITDVVDVDNETSSHLQEDYPFEWKTKDFASVVASHPQHQQNITVGRSLAFRFSEPIQEDFELDGMISPDEPKGWSSDWTFEWYSTDSKHLRLDHIKPFPHSAQIKLKVTLSRLRAEQDGSKVTADGSGSSLLSLSFKTRKKFRYPEVASCCPRPGSTDISPSKDIELRFDKEMDPGSLQLSSEPSIEVEEFSWSEDNKELTINHTGLEELQRYKIFLKINDSEGGPLNESRNPFMFTTKDVTPPKVNSVSHHDDLKRYLTEAPISLIFSESMKKESLRFDGSDSCWTVSWNMDRTRVHLSHDEFLSGSRCWFRLKNARDEYGNPIPYWQREQLHFRTSEEGNEIQATLPDRKLWSFVGGDIVENSLNDKHWALLGMFNTFGEKTASGIERTKSQENLEYRVPLELGEGSYSYERRLNSLEENLEDEETRELSFTVDLQPDHIELEGQSLDPSVISTGEGKHLTSVHRLSDRAPCQYWRIDLSSLSSSPVHLGIEKEEPFTFEDGKPSRLSFNKTFQLDYQFFIPVITGWHLQDFEYSTRGRSLLNVTDFLRNNWERLREPFFRLKDAALKISELIQRVGYDLHSYEEKYIKAVQLVAKRYVNRTASEALITRDYSCFDRRIKISGSDLDIETSDSWENCTVPGEEIIESGKVNMSVPRGRDETTSRFTMMVLRNGTAAFGRDNTSGLNITYKMEPSPEISSAKNKTNWLECRIDFNSGAFSLDGPMSVKAPAPLDGKSKGEGSNQKKFQIALSDDIEESIDVRLHDDTTDLDLGFIFELTGRTSGILDGTIQEAYRDALNKSGLNAGSSDPVDKRKVVDFARVFIRNLERMSPLASNWTDQVSFFMETGGGKTRMNYRLDNVTDRSFKVFLSSISSDIDTLIENNAYQRFSLKSYPIFSSTSFHLSMGQNETYMWRRRAGGISVRIEEGNWTSLRLVYKAG